MSKVLYFDYAAFCVFTLIMVSVIMKKMTRGKLNRQFQFVLTIAMVATAFDIGAIAFDNMGERHVVTQYIFHTGYLFFHVVSSAMYAAYVVNIVDAIHIFRGKVKSFILALPTLLCMIMLGVNFFHSVCIQYRRTGRVQKRVFHDISVCCRNILYDSGLHGCYEISQETYKRKICINHSDIPIGCCCGRISDV